MPANGGFERFSTQDNLWDGVSSTGQLAGFRSEAQILMESGSVGAYPMPSSVAVADMNNDGLLDLIVADPAGYLRIYFNKGTKTEPVFTNSELIPVFLPLSDKNGGVGYSSLLGYGNRTPIKIAVTDMRSRGLYDLVIGNYIGEMYFLQNMGTPNAPDFRQPKTPEAAILPTSKDGKLWANLLAPAVIDMNGDRNWDLLVGEGSYSANNIHLFINQGNSGNPKFSEDNRHVIVYGDGKEQLTPAVVDYNGDGLPDIIVGDRHGELSVYLHPGKSWKPGDEFKFASTVKLGTSTRMPGPIAPCAADLNGDGLFDLIIGKTNGRIAIAYNKGTAQEPKFDAPVEIKGQNVEPSRNRVPTSWDIYTGFQKGNALIRAISVDTAEDENAAPTEGKFAFRASFMPNFNQIMKPLDLRIPNAFKGSAWNARLVRENFGRDAGTKLIALRNHAGLPLKLNTNYQISFDVKGTGVRDGQFAVGWEGYKKRSEGRTKTEDRGSVRVSNDEVREQSYEGATFNVTPQWQSVSRAFRVTLKGRDLQDLPRVTTAVVHISAELSDPKAVWYIDNVKIEEKP